MLRWTRAPSRTSTAWCCPWSTSPAPWQRPPPRQKRWGGEAASCALFGVRATRHEPPGLKVRHARAAGGARPPAGPPTHPLQLPVCAAHLLCCRRQGAGGFRAVHGAAQVGWQPLPPQCHRGARRVGRGWERDTQQRGAQQQQQHSWIWSGQRNSDARASPLHKQRRSVACHCSLCSGGCGTGARGVRARRRAARLHAHLPAQIDWRRGGQGAAARRRWARGGGGVDHGRGSTRHAACWPSVSFLLPPTCHPCHPDSQPTCPPRSSSFSRRRRALRCAAARRGAHGAPHCLRRALSPQLWAGGACRAGGLPGAVSAAEWVCIHTVV